MALEEYKRKRDFKITKEPAPGKVVKREKQLSYLVQKHDATRLHYDFRLELDGVLLSWAVTKGPSYNPADKRLAVRTEDHPLSYGSFEGTIPKGQYGGGTVMLWDTGTWEPQDDAKAGLKAGNFKFILHGERLKGKWALIRMHGHAKGDDKRENWLLIKEKDELATPDADAMVWLEKMASSITTGRSMDEIAVDAPAAKKPAGKAMKAGKASVKAAPQYDRDVAQLMKTYPDVQLATLVDAPPESDKWVHEIKFDGYRLLAFLSGTEVRLRTRNGNDWTDKFPSIRASMSRLKCENAVLDLEAVVMDPLGKSSFQALQHALGEGGRPEQMIGYVFDILHLDGENLMGLPLLKRKEKLAALLKKSKDAKFLKYSEHVAGQGAAMLAKSCDMGLEGIICKQADAPYRTGRQKSWLKAKCARRQEFVILGYAGPKKGDRAVGALYLGYFKDGKLTYAGKVGTGFTMKDAVEMKGKFDALAVTQAQLPKSAMSDVPGPEYRAVTWVKPALLCEVQFTEWTDDGHIRHPSFQGMREDKEAKDVKMEKPVPVETVEKEVQPVAKIKKPVPAKKVAAASAVKKTAPAKDAVQFYGINITHPERVVSDIGHVTKGELAEYYATVAPFMLPSLKDRAITLLRCPDGADNMCFYQRNPGRGLGPDVFPFKWTHNGKHYEYLYLKDEKGLMEIVQMNAIEIHPWGAKIEKIDFPDRMIFDLDPDPTVPFEAVKLAAQDLRQRLKKVGLESFLKCTGGKGLHVTVPLAEKDDWPAVKEWAGNFARQMVTDSPDAYVATMTKAKRTGKIFIDFFRNDYTATAVADFGVRARPGAPVAMPVEWSDLKGLTAGNEFTIEKVLARIKKRKPDMERYKLKQRLPK